MMYEVSDGDSVPSQSQSSADCSPSQTAQLLACKEASPGAPSSDALQNSSAANISSPSGSGDISGGPQLLRKNSRSRKGKEKEDGDFEG
ncbi:hypothetical protein I350_00036 [Cryptococcus amylolentus CBS 6273]|uniref:Uncharacterized protein n=1 Tax=Cryptococcus amylolentus CBS 6273 TaxID=1296118 RepID=A0A1E3KDU1_9TREE|nr:hypothetical protein I350_00036 [Cryptococcus amylolentus CBS 6273]